MKRFKRLAVMVVALVSFAMLAGCGYVTQSGNYYSDAQVRQYCSHLRPGSADYQRFDCANRLANTP